MSTTQTKNWFFHEDTSWCFHKDSNFIGKPPGVISSRPKSKMAFELLTAATTTSAAAAGCQCRSNFGTVAYGGGSGAQEKVRK